MTRRSWAVAGLAALASLTLATTACQSANNATGATTAPSKNATETLQTAAAKTKGQSFKFTLAYGDLFTGDGVQDGKGAAASVNVAVAEPTSGLNLKLGLLVVGTDMYLKMDFGALGGMIPGLENVGDKWMHLDSTKASAANLNFGVKIGSDAIGADTYVKGVTSAETVSATEIKGTLDLTKSAPPGTSPDDLNALGDAAKNVPFTATLDGQGRITKIVIKMPKVDMVPAADLVTTYSDYGSPVTLSKPAAAQVVEAPAMIYQFLG